METNKLTTLTSDKQLTPQLVEQATEIAKNERIPLSGLTMLGGKFYINVTGLDVKMKNKCNDEHLVLMGVEYIVESKATKEETRASGYGIVRLFDKVGFEKALKNAGVVTVEIINELKKLYVYEFKMRGFASPASLKMSTMQNIDNVEMMAERRATNRAKREAVGTGLTSVDEVEGMVTDTNIYTAPERKQAEQVVDQPAEPVSPVNEEELRIKFNQEIGEFSRIAGLDGIGISNVINSTLYKYKIKGGTTEGLSIEHLKECRDMFAKIAEANKK